MGVVSFMLLLAGPVTNSDRTPLLRRDPGEHNLLGNCLDKNGKQLSQMAYWRGDVRGSPEAIATVKTSTPNLFAVWEGGAPISAIFVDGNTFSASILTGITAQGAYAGTGKNDYSGFTCWRYVASNVWSANGTTCDALYDCNHQNAPAATSTSIATTNPPPPSQITIHTDITSQSSDTATKPQTTANTVNTATTIQTSIRVSGQPSITGTTTSSSTDHQAEQPHPTNSTGPAAGHSTQSTTMTGTAQPLGNNNDSTLSQGAMIATIVAPILALIGGILSVFLWWFGPHKRHVAQRKSERAASTTTETTRKGLIHNWLTTVRPSDTRAHSEVGNNTTMSTMSNPG